MCVILKELSEIAENSLKYQGISDVMPGVARRISQLAQKSCRYVKIPNQIRPLSRWYTLGIFQT